jgi:folylpolyglutamate synthase
MLFSAPMSHRQNQATKKVKCCAHIIKVTTDNVDFVNKGYDPSAIDGLTVQKAFAAKWSELDEKANVVVMPSIEEAIDYVRALQDKDGVSGFITGSLHLIGGALSVLEDANVL